MATAAAIKAKVTTMDMGVIIQLQLAIIMATAATIRGMVITMDMVGIILDMATITVTAAIIQGTAITTATERINQDSGNNKGKIREKVPDTLWVSGTFCIL